MQSAFNNSTFQKVAAAIERSTGIKAHGISLSTQLGEDLALDQSSRQKLALQLQESHGIELSLTDMERFASIADIVTCSSRQYFKDIQEPAAAMVV